MDGSSQARGRIGVAIREQGGVYQVAKLAGLHFTQVYRFLAGKDLTPENRGRLRGAVADVPAEVWADAFAAVPEPQPEAASA